MSDQTERAGRYAEALLPFFGDGVSGTREFQAGRMAAAVMAVADAEQESLRAEVEQAKAQRKEAQDEAKRAQAEVDRLERNQSGLLCELTGGNLSKTTYDVRTMVQEIEAYFQDDVDEVSSQVEELQAKVAAVEALADEWGYPVKYTGPAEDAWAVAWNQAFNATRTWGASQLRTVLSGPSEEAQTEP